MIEVFADAVHVHVRSLRRAVLLVAMLVGATWLSPFAPAARADHERDYGTIGLSSSDYIAHEDQGDVPITIVRTDTSYSAQIRYGVRQQTALNGEDFDVVPNSFALLEPGQSSFTFMVHIRDNGMNGPAILAHVYLFGAFPERLGNPSEATLTILRDDPLQVRDDANPLGAPTTSSIGDPLQGVKFYVPGSSSPAGEAEEAALAHGDGTTAQALSVLAQAPTGYRFWFWNTPSDPSGNVARYLERTQLQQPGTTVQLTTYSLVHGRCDNNLSPAFVKRYQRWVRGYARGIGNFHVVVFFEIDSLITSSCLSANGRRVRFEKELAYGIRTLERDPHTVVYVDAGAADALPWQATVRDLRQADVQAAQGFFLNATHFDWTTTELAYGQKVSKALGGVHFVINTGENGRGPLRPASRVQNGNEVLCNPPGRGLGPWSTTTGYESADAFIWMSTPGNSAGACRPGAPPTATYWPAYAVMLVQNADYQVSGPPEPLVRQGSFVPEQP